MQVEHLRRGSPALVIFQGPSAFVSASSYVTTRALPTWNHVSVHVTGRPQLLDDPEDVLDVLERTFRHFEQQAGTGWRLDVGDDQMRRLAHGVIAFRMSAERIDAAFKLSQNVDDDERGRVAERLSRPGHHALVQAMHDVAPGGTLG